MGERLRISGLKISQTISDFYNTQNIPKLSLCCKWVIRLPEKTTCFSCFNASFEAVVVVFFHKLTKWMP